MSSERDVVALFEEANPVPTLDVIGDVVDDDALELLFERRDQMVESSSRESNGSGRRRLLMASAAIATVVVTVGVIWIMTGGGGSDEVITPSPTTLGTIPESNPSTTIEETQTTEPEPTTTLDPAEAAWEEITPFVSGIRGGEYRTVNFEPAFKFTTQSGWTLTDIGIDTASRVAMHKTNGFNPQLSFFRFEWDTVEETADAFTSRPVLNAQPSEPVAVGGATGLRFDAFPAENVLIGASTTCVAGGVCSFYVVDVDGTVVTILVNTVSQSEFNRLGPEAEEIIASVVWRTLSETASEG